MAITKIHAIKSTLGKALAYIENPDKTDGQMLVSGYNCEPQTASIDFEMTAVLAHKARNLKRKRSTNLAYHLIQSFSPEDAVTPEQAHELGKKLAFEYTGGKYEYVVATHIDKGHIHNHIMINAVSFYDYKKLRTVPYRTARQIRDISDRLCMEAHLSVIDDPQKIGQLYPENAGKKKSVSNRTEIRKRLNFCLERATDYSQFLSMAKGLEITPTIRGKHISYLLEGAGQSVRDNSLSDTDTFTYAGICARLSDNAQEQKYLRKTITGILRSATGMADFADKLKTAGIETKVKKATGQVLYRATVLDGAWVPEDALGSEFTSEGIEYALKNGKMQITEDAEITLLDRYQKLTMFRTFLSQLLRNPVYAQADLELYEFFKSQGAAIVNDASDFAGTNGCYLYQGREVKEDKDRCLKDQILVIAPHEALISSDTWLKCRKKLMANTTFQQGRKPKNTWLAGKIKCGHCGYALKATHVPNSTGYFRCTKRTENKGCPGCGKIRKEEFEQFIFSAMQEKFKDFQILHGREEKVNPKLTAYQVELAQVEAEIEKLLDTLTGANATLLAYANKKIEELDTRRQTISKAIAELSVETISPQQIKKLSYYLDNWESIDFDDKRKAADGLISTIKATSDRVQIEWKI